MNDRKEEEAVIEFSARLAETFKEKVKEHNGSCPNKVTLAQVIKVYRHGAETFHTSNEPDQGINEWSMARVNMFLRMKRGEVTKNKSQTKPLKETMSALVFETRSSIKRVNSFLDLTKNWIPAEEDFELAKGDVKKNQLNYNFKSAEEIYLTDGSRSSHSIEILY
jgi:hypothetical protein